MPDMIVARHAARSRLAAVSSWRAMSTVPSWATVDPWTMSADKPAVGKNLCGGVWTDAAATHAIVDPLNGEEFCLVPNTTVDEIGPFVERMKNCPRSGLHNPLKNVERYNMLGEVMTLGSRELAKPEVAEFFGKLIQRLVPKSWAQAIGEPTVSACTSLGELRCTRASAEHRPRPGWTSSVSRLAEQALRRVTFGCVRLARAWLAQVTRKWMEDYSTDQVQSHSLSPPALLRAPLRLQAQAHAWRVACATPAWRVARRRCATSHARLASPAITWGRPRLAFACPSAECRSSRPSISRSRSAPCRRVRPSSWVTSRRSRSTGRSPSAWSRCACARAWE